MFLKFKIINGTIYVRFCTGVYYVENCLKYVRNIQKVFKKLKLPKGIELRVYTYTICKTVFVLRELYAYIYVRLFIFSELLLHFF